MDNASLRKPKIALMTYAVDNRRGKGTALAARELMEHLLEDKRFEFYLVHYDKVDDPLYKRAHEIIMPMIKLPYGTRFVRQMLFFWKYRNERFDIMHWFQPRLYPFFWFAPARRLVATLFGAGDVTAPGAFPFSRRMFNFVLRHFNSRVDAMIAASEFGKEEVVEWYHAKPESVYVIFLGGGENFSVLDKTESRRIAKKRYGIEGNFILDISLHTRHKNIPSLIRAYIITRGKGVSHKLVIVGANCEYLEEAYKVARESAYATDIIFVPYVESSDLNAIYCAADLFAFPSLNESFGLPVVEAFASGTPVVTSNITSLPEIAGDAAITVDPLDVVSIAEGIYRALSDEKLSASLREKGLARAQDFTWKHTEERTVKLYQRLLSLNGGNGASA